MTAPPPLDPARVRDAAELFADALELTADERASLLDRACAADPELRGEVDSLLAAHAAAGDAFRTPPRVAPEIAGAELGRELGPYRLVSLIASGGMGSVYEAERVDREFRKRVAIKLVRAGPGASELHERLRFERQVLAGLEHPNIARLIDGGSTADGVPFLVMEFVDGTPIDRFADTRRLPVADRLRLFLEVCEAVRFAHRHLVVHRDLKPGNILVDAAGRVKLLDFGIAKVLEAAATDPGPGVTALRAMTPRYASPEQIRRLPVTTSTDVYSLGVVLYELLCGAPPYRLEGLSTADSERLICETVPREPSVLARTDAAVAGLRSTTPARLARLLEGDLDTIVLKAVAKEPGRRYSSVEELAADLRRHLAGEAVLARPDSARYRIGRFARRHRAGVATAGGIVLLLVAFAVAMGVQARRVAAERDRASAAAAEALAVSVFLQDVLRAADPGQPEGLGRSATVEQAVDRAARRLEAGAFAAQPNVEAAVRRALGTSYLGLGLHAAAERQFERALEIRRRLEGGRGPGVAEALGDLAALRHAQGRPAVADSILREVLAMQRGARDTPRHDMAHTINNLGVMRRELGAAAEAESLYRVARGLYEASGADVQQVAGNLTNLAIVLVEQGRPAEAGPLLLEAVERYRSALGPDHPDVARALGGLGQLRRRQGDVAGADSAYQAMVEIRRRALGPDHPDYAVALNNLSAVRRDQARYPSAESLLREALGIWRRTLGERHPNVATGMSNLATLLLYQGRFEPADSLAGEALAIRREAFGPEHPDVALSLYQLGVVRLDAGRPGRAEPVLRQSLAIRQRVLPARHVDTAESMAALGRCLLDLGRVAEAERLLRESVAIQAERGSTHWRRYEAMSLLGAALTLRGNRAEGESLMVAARDSLEVMNTAPQLRRTQARERLEGARSAAGPGGPPTARAGD